MNQGFFKRFKLEVSGLSTMDYRLWTVLFLLISLSASAQTITRAEYFFDSDPGVGNATALTITPSATINQTYNLSTTSLGTGFHTFNARVRDNTGKWSLFATRTFYIIPNPFSLSPSVNITRAEYFYDTDPGIGNGVNIPVTANPAINLTINTPTTALTAGFHTVNTRVRDDKERWSLFTTRTFYLMPASVLPANLVKLEYYVDTDPGVGQATSVSIAQAPTVNQLFNLNLPVLTPGSYTLNVRAKDSKGFWSSRVSANFTITPCTPPTPPTSSGASRCGNGTIDLTASGASGAQVYRWYADAATTTILFTGPTFTTPSLNATTTYHVSIFDPATCESSRTLVTATINSLPTAPTTIGASACGNASVSLTASGGTNGQYKWYTVASGGTAITGEVNGTYTTPSLTTTTDYFVSITNGSCESARTKVTATIITAGCAPTIAADKQSTEVEGKVEFDPGKLITTTGTLDPASIKIITQPKSGAVASIVGSLIIIDYKGISFSGTESVVIEACNTNGACSQQTFNIEVSSEIMVYNAVSPEGKNPVLYLKYIDSLFPKNQVSIYNRWGDEVFSISDYDNKTRVFAGLTNGGSKLPSGTYFYKIVLPNAGKTLTGFLSLKY